MDHDPPGPPDPDRTPPLRRRHLLQALAALPLAAVAGRAEAATTDLVLSCDTALGRPMNAAAQRFLALKGVQVRVFPTGPGLLVPQLARRIQNDILVTHAPVMEAAVAGGLIAGGPRGAWRNPLVLAARRGAGPAALKGRIAVSDATPGSDMDGPAILAALDLGPSSVRGVIDTDEVLALVAAGEVEAGLLHASDVAGRSDLEVVRPVPPAVAPPLAYAVAVTTLARRPNPGAFVDFLVSREGNAVLAAQGLEGAA